MALRIGVVGGTGLYAWPGAEILLVETEHGDVSLAHARVRGADVFFLPRHGPGHEVPAHAVAHRANVRALVAARVDYALGVFNVGALDATLTEGTWVVPDDVLDASGGAPVTFHDAAAVHMDMTRPFCPTLRRAVLSTAAEPVRDGGVYACVSGPRFETRAEAQALRASGGHVVGMTAAPEATLAREAGLCYAALCFAASPAAGLGAGGPARALQARLARRASEARRWVVRAVARLPERKRCDCARRTEGARLGPVRGRAR